MRETDLTVAHLVEMGFVRNGRDEFVFSVPPASEGLPFDLAVTAREELCFEVAVISHSGAGHSKVCLSSLPGRLTVERVKALLLVLMQPYLETREYDDETSIQTDS